VPLIKSVMLNSMVSKLPSEWQPQWADPAPDPLTPPRQWVDAVFADIITMWSTWTALPFNMDNGGATSPASHKHAVVIPFVPVTIAALALGYTGNPSGLAAQYFTALATEIATHFGTIETNVYTAGATLHDHSLPGPVTIPVPPVPPNYDPPYGVATPPLHPFASTAGDLKDAIIGALGGLSPPVEGTDVIVTPGDPPVTENSLEVIFTAFSEAVCEHVANYAVVASSIDPVTPTPGHWHVVS